MVTRPIELIPDDARVLIKELIGQTCTLQRIGSDRSLFIGFGEVDETRTMPHGAIEIGTYDCAWRVSLAGKVLCGKNDAVDDVSELQACFSKINLGEILEITQTSEFDVRIRFSTNICVDILCTISDGDEVLHIFFPMKKVVTFCPNEGWRFGRSDEPWK
jgi:hypothetical protein